MLSVNVRKVVEKRRRYVKDRHEFAIKSPSVAKNMYDALFLAANKLDELEGDGASEYDDVLQVEVRGNEIVVWFVHEQEEED